MKSIAMDAGAVRRKMNNLIQRRENWQNLQSLNYIVEAS